MKNDEKKKLYNKKYREKQKNKKEKTSNIEEIEEENKEIEEIKDEIKDEIINNIVNNIVNNQENKEDQNQENKENKENQEEEIIELDEDYINKIIDEKLNHFLELRKRKPKNKEKNIVNYSWIKSIIWKTSENAIQAGIPISLGLIIKYLGPKLSQNTIKFTENQNTRKNFMNLPQTFTPYS